jgi:cell division protein FtsB
MQLRLLRTFLLICLCLVLWAVANYDNLRALAQARAERDRERATLQQMEGQIASLRRRRQALATDLSAVERAAREQFKMTEPGEVLILVEREAPRQ